MEKQLIYVQREICCNLAWTRSAEQTEIELKIE